MMVDKRFGQAGARLVIEELLVGREASFFVLERRHARAAAGIGRGSQARVRRRCRPEHRRNGRLRAELAVRRAPPQSRVMNEIVLPVLEGMRAEGSEFRGFLFVGLMLTADGPKVIEFNVRFGDPEAQVMLPMIEDDLSALLMSAAAGELDAGRISLRSGAARRRGAWPRAVIRTRMKPVK